MKELGIISEYVFSDEIGERMNPQLYYRHWIRYRNHNKMSKATTYELRHTFVSIVKTLPEGLLKPLIGHSKDMDSYGVYSHEVEGDMIESANEIEKIFKTII